MQTLKSRNFFPYLLLILGIIGFLAAFILTTEKIALLKDPHYIPSCNLSPLLSCGSVMKTHQASEFGFPNSLLGIGGFAAVATVGATMLAGAQFKRWFWLTFQGGIALAMGFIFWLQYQSIFSIRTLCPYCMVVWAVTIPIFWYTTLYNFREANIGTPKSLRGVIGFAQRHHLDILVVWYLVIIGVILSHFWYYWKTLI